MHMLCMQRLHREGKQHKGLVASGQLAMEFLAFLLTQGSSTDILRKSIWRSITLIMRHVCALNFSSFNFRVFFSKS